MAMRCWVSISLSTAAESDERSKGSKVSVTLDTPPLDTTTGYDPGWHADEFPAFLLAE